MLPGAYRIGVIVRARVTVAVTCAVGLSLGGCLSPGQRAELIQQREALRTERDGLKRQLAQRDGTITRLQGQVTHLQGFGRERAVDLFAPTRLEILSRSGGTDRDGAPGDDVVTVYLRLRDADGDVVKSPGKITVQLLDNDDLDAPRVLGVYVLDGPDELRRAWYGSFGTHHYTLRCPLQRSVTLPISGRVQANAQFVDFLSGRTLTATATLPVWRGAS